MQEKIERDLKAALLSGDKLKVETLKGIKNALLYEAVSLNARETGLTDDQIQKVFAKEARKRAESAEIYKSVGETERADKELSEKLIIDNYLPEQVSEADIKLAVEEEAKKYQSPTNADMGKMIGSVKAKFGASADGGLIARLVKETINN